MAVSYKKISLNQDAILLGFLDLTYSHEKNYKNIECIAIELESDLTIIKFGYYSGYKFIDCPIWIGNVLTNDLKYQKEKYQFGFSFLNDTLLSYHVIEIKNKQLSIDDLLSHLIRLINFLNYYISCKKTPYLFESFIDSFNKSDFGGLPFDYTQGKLFKIMQNVKFLIANENESVCQVHISNFDNYKNYFLAALNKILNNELNLQNISLIDNRILVVDINKRYFFQETLKTQSTHTDIVKVVRDTIMFFWSNYFNENDFFYSVFESTNNKELSDSLLELLLFLK